MPTSHAPDRPPSIDQLPTESPPSRVQDLFSNLFLTLLSIIQGAAFVYLAERVLTEGPRLEVAGWIEAAATLLLIVFVWHRVVMAILAFFWMPTFADAALPFALGAAELLLAHNVGPDPTPWLGAMTVVWAVVLLDNMYTDTRIFRDASGGSFRLSGSLARRSFLMPIVGLLVPATLFVLANAGAFAGLPAVGPALVLGLLVGLVVVGIVAPRRF